MHLLFSRKFRGITWCLLTISTSLYAQAPNPGSIAGTVLNRTTSAPIRRAIVTLSTVEAQPQDAVAWTDAAGRFSFGFLPAGRYQLQAAKEGLQGSGFAAEQIGLAAGENRTGLTLRLNSISIISGVIFDDAGDPLPGANVQVLKPGYQRRKRTYLQITGTSTDAEGRYRVAGLMPGAYVVMAQAHQPIVKAQAEVSSGQMQQPRLYAMQYFPGTGSAETATVIKVEPGKDLEQISFRLSLAAMASTVQGTVSVPPGMSSSVPIGVLFSSADSGGQYTAGTQAIPPDFAFRMDNLRQGKYVVAARASVDGREFSARQEVDLRGEVSPIVMLTLERGIDLSGTVSVEGKDAARYSIEFVSLNPGDARAQQVGQTLNTRVNKSGSFTIRNVPPGVWDINAGPIPPGCYVKSMRLGTQDVLTEVMTISSKTASPLNIVIGTQAATIAGQITGNTGQPAKLALLLAPDGKFKNGTSFYRSAATDEKGHFEIKGITPGKYRLYAIEEFDPGLMHDSELLKPLERFSVEVDLKDGAAATQNLTFTAGVGVSQ